jgi:hypothetical protein
MSGATGGITGPTTTATGNEPVSDEWIMEQVAQMFFQKLALEKIMEFQAEMKEDEE